MKEQEKSVETSGRGCSRLPLVLSSLALIISIVFGFGLTQNISGLRDEVVRVSEQSAMRGEIEGMRSDIAALKTRLDGFADLDTVARKAVLSASMLELTQRVGLLAGIVENDEYARKLNEAMRLMQEIQSDLGK